MVTLNRIRSLLDEQRKALLDQVDAVDRAIAALDSAGITAAGTEPAEASAVADAAATAVVPRRVTPRRKLSESHKQALARGHRKAREAKEVAQGLAREMPDDSFVPAIGTRSDREPPRLVKRPVKTSRE